MSREFRWMHRNDFSGALGLTLLPGCAHARIEVLDQSHVSDHSSSVDAVATQLIPESCSQKKTYYMSSVV